MNVLGFLSIVFVYLKKRISTILAFFVGLLYNENIMEKNTDFSEKKRSLRRTVLPLLSSVPDRESRELAVTEKALAYVKTHDVHKVAVYLSGKGELSTDRLIDELHSLGIGTFAPIIVGEREMVFSEVKKGDVFATNRYGLREPVLRKTEDDFDVIFVPLVAFDASFRRLGRGKGFYDRFLQGKDVVSIGLAFSEQQVEKVPCDEWDKPLDLVIFA